MAINWEQVRILFEYGKSLNEISKETGVNKGSISKKAKKEGWEKSGKATLVKQEVDTILMQKEIATQKATLSNPELQQHNKEVHEAINKAEILNMFDNTTVKNQVAINKIQDRIVNKEELGEDDIMSLGSLSKITETNRKQILGNTDTYKKDTKEEEETRSGVGELYKAIENG